jgi:hypothetical protein
MKVIFAGPSLSGVIKSANGCRFLPPAAQGDVAQAALDGATVIGIIDGVYETVAAVWHKEILFALNRGVRVLGAASMGALRAAECAAFGMEAVGDIAGRYLSGELDDDAAVAVIHAPAELDYLPLNEALVDVEATLSQLRLAGAISPAERTVLFDTACRIFFKFRTVEQIVELAAVTPERRSEILAAYRVGRVSLKRQDALALIERVLAAEPTLSQPPEQWEPARPANWRAVLARLSARPDIWEESIGGAAPNAVSNA